MAGLLVGGVGLGGRTLRKARTILSFARAVMAKTRRERRHRVRQNWRARTASTCAGNCSISAAGVRGTHDNDQYGQLMSNFAKSLPDDQAVRDVVAYIETLQPLIFPLSPTQVGGVLEKLIFQRRRLVLVQYPRLMLVAGKVHAG